MTEQRSVFHPDLTVPARPAVAQSPSVQSPPIPTWPETPPPPESPGPELVQPAASPGPVPQVITIPAFTREQFMDALPAKMKKSVNQQVIDDINRILGSEHELEEFRNNLISYGDVLKDGRFKITQYVSAVRYVSHKLLGATNKDAFIKTFPDKYQDWMAAGIQEKDIASYITAFNKSKLVNLILEQTLVPTHVLNAPLLQTAINVQAELMLSAKSEKVKCDAAACLIATLKPPEMKKFEIDIGTKNDDAVDELRATLHELAKMQREMIVSGRLTVNQVAELPLARGGDVDD